MWPIDYPLGTFRDGRWAAYRLTNGRVYLLLPRKLDEKLQGASPVAYWRFMALQLRRIGLSFTPDNAWRAFTD